MASLKHKAKNRGTNAMSKQKEKSPFFHDIVKGCTMVEQKRIVGYSRGDSWANVENPQFIIRQRCLTHDKIVCKCGWEMGNHYGTSTAWLNEHYRNHPHRI